nr:immunoglobulin heavy chain junction region [Macaca mulatta]MOY25246.1 immunoglobulin heavy chain junction region [Macaca mulatta]MOY26294.1 immunoglobulin heavy chain junction region [Macaca mulatta]
CVPNLDYW